jgi:hypothetical protein
MADAGVRQTLALGMGARMGSLDAGVLIALECKERWRVRDAGAEKRARIGYLILDAGVLIALACEGPWR